MKKQFLEAGKIVNTHGVRGEVKILPWADSAAFLQEFETLYLNEDSPIRITSARVHKQTLIAKIDGIDDVPSAVPLKNKVVYIDRADADLPPGDFFLQDIIGLPVIDADNNTQIGTLKEVLSRPAGDLYVVLAADGTERLIPDVPAFILEKNVAEGFLRVRLIEGL